EVVTRWPHGNVWPDHLLRMPRVAELSDEPWPIYNNDCINLFYIIFMNNIALPPFCGKYSFLFAELWHVLLCKES
ncbi:MAG: hypothetical protein QW789_03165, partial [Nitrososphaerota archaeon]